MFPSNPFDDAAVAARYEDWYSGPGRRADALEKSLLKGLLADFPGARTVLEVGCGTGHFTRWLASFGLDVTGLDSSCLMLAVARRLGGATFHQGDALALPFADRGFDFVTLITTLEFVSDPARALAEALRVAREGVLLGVLNRCSLLAASYRFTGKPVWRRAHFFTPRELARMIRQIADTRLQSLHWRTTLWPLPFIQDLPPLGRLQRDGCGLNGRSLA